MQANPLRASVDRGEVQIGTGSIWFVIPQY